MNNAINKNKIKCLRNINENLYAGINKNVNTLPDICTPGLSLVKLRTSIRPKIT